MQEHSFFAKNGFNYDQNKGKRREIRDGINARKNIETCFNTAKWEAGN